VNYPVDSVIQPLNNWGLMSKGNVSYYKRHLLFTKEIYNSAKRYQKRKFEHFVFQALIWRQKWVIRVWHLAL